jgi:hypothetical protein
MMLALQRRIDRHLTPARHSPANSDKYSDPEKHFFSDLIAAAQLSIPWKRRGFGYAARSS